MQSNNKALIRLPIVVVLILTSVLQLRADERDAKNLEIERRVEEELARRQKTQGVSGSLANIYGFYSDYLIGQPKNIEQAINNQENIAAGRSFGSVGTVIGGLLYTGTLKDRKTIPPAKTFNRVGKGMVLLGVPFTIWGIHRGIRDAQLLNWDKTLSNSHANQDYVAKLPSGLETKKQNELKRDISARWNLNKLFAKYGDAQQAILFENFYELAQKEVSEYLKDLPMESRKKEQLISEIAAERAMRRYLSLEASPEIQADIQKWLDLNAESVKDVARKAIASSEVLKPHVQSGTAVTPAQTHTDRK